MQASLGKLVKRTKEDSNYFGAHLRHNYEQMYLLPHQININPDQSIDREDRLERL